MFAAWRSWCGRRVRSRRVLQRLMSSHSKSGMLSGWRRWRECTLQSREAELRSELRHQEEALAAARSVHESAADDASSRLQEQIQQHADSMSAMQMRLDGAADRERALQRKQRRLALDVV